LWRIDAGKTKISEHDPKQSKMEERCLVEGYMESTIEFAITRNETTTTHPDSPKTSNFEISEGTSFFSSSLRSSLPSW
jgi:hypothetical protein